MPAKIECINGKATFDHLLRRPLVKTAVLLEPVNVDNCTRLRLGRQVRVKIFRPTFAFEHFFLHGDVSHSLVVGVPRAATYGTHGLPYATHMPRAFPLVSRSFPVDEDE